MEKRNWIILFISIFFVFFSIFVINFFNSTGKIISSPTIISVMAKMYFKGDASLLQSQCNKTQLVVKSDSGKIEGVFYFDVTDKFQNKSTSFIILNTTRHYDFVLNNSCCLGWNGARCSIGDNDLHIENVYINKKVKRINATLKEDGDEFSFSGE